MHPAYKLNKQDDNIQPCCTPFPILNQPVLPCKVLTVAIWPAYRFLKRQVKQSGTPIPLRIIQFVVIHTVKGFTQGSRSRHFTGIHLLSLWSNECWQFDFWFLCLFETQLVHLEVLGSCIVEAWLERFLSITLLACEMSTNRTVVWAFFEALPFFRLGMQTVLFSAVATAEFSRFVDILSAAL